MQTLRVAKKGLNVGGFSGAHSVEVTEGDLEHFPVEKQECGKRLASAEFTLSPSASLRACRRDKLRRSVLSAGVLGGGSDLLVNGEGCEELFDLGYAQVGGMTKLMKANVAFIPVEISFFGSARPELVKGWNTHAGG